MNTTIFTASPISLHFMKSFLSIFAIFVLLDIFVFSSLSNCAPMNPSISWEQHSELTKISLNLNGDTLLVSVKNASNTSKKLIAQENGTLIKVFYVDDSGKLSSITDHPTHNDPRDDEVEGAVWNDLSSSGETLRIVLSPEQLAQVKLHPVTCRIILVDPASKQRYFIASKPQMVVDGP